MGSEDEGPARSAGCSGRPMALMRSVNAGVCDCRLPDAVDEANKLANTLLLVPPLLVELVLLLQLPFRAVLACGSSMICGEFSGSSERSKQGEKAVVILIIIVDIIINKREKE